MFIHTYKVEIASFHEDAIPTKEIVCTALEDAIENIDSAGSLTVRATPLAASKIDFLTPEKSKSSERKETRR